MFKKNNKVKRINDFCISIKDEDHTLMNTLQFIINKNFSGKSVELCGYVIPHPSEKESHLRIQFQNETDQTYKNILLKTNEGLDIIKQVSNKLKLLLDKEIENFNNKI